MVGRGRVVHVLDQARDRSKPCNPGRVQAPDTIDHASAAARRCHEQGLQQTEPLYRIDQSVEREWTGRGCDIAIDLRHGKLPNGQQHRMSRSRQLLHVVRIVTHPEAGREAFTRPRPAIRRRPLFEIFQIVRLNVLFSLNVVFNERAVAVQM
jgi:hypothetical protein